MAAFINNGLTANGLALLAKGIAGESIRFSKIVIGDGELPPGKNASELTDLINPLMDIEITNITINEDQTVTVSGAFTNAQLNEGFYYREIGLKAMDPDVGEILYCVGNAGNFAEWIAPTGSETIIEKIVNVITVIGTTENVSAYIKSDTCVTAQDFENVIKTLNSSIEKKADTATVNKALAQKANTSHTHNINDMNFLRLVPADYVDISNVQDGKLNDFGVVESNNEYYTTETIYGDGKEATFYNIDLISIRSGTSFFGTTSIESGTEMLLEEGRQYQFSFLRSDYNAGSVKIVHNEEYVEILSAGLINTIQKMIDDRIDKALSQYNLDVATEAEIKELLDEVFGEPGI